MAAAELAGGRGTRLGVGTAAILGLAGRGAWAIRGAVGWRVFSLEALTSPMLRKVRMAALREEALAPPNTAPITCFLPRRTEATRLKPEARV